MRHILAALLLTASPALALDGVAAPSAHLRERLAAMTAAARRSATI